MFMSSTLEASDNLHSVKKIRKNLTLKQMFAISEKLILEHSEEIFGVTGKILHQNSYLWSMMKKSSVSRMRRFMYFQILCYVLER